MEWFNTDYFTAIGQTLIHSLWQGVLIALLYFIAKQLFADQPARFRFRLAASALFAQFIFTISTFMLVLSNSAEISLVGNQHAQIGKSLIIITAADQWSPSWIALIGIFWLVGTIYFILRFGIGWWQTNQIRTNGFRLSNYWQSQCEILSNKMGLNKTIELLSSKNVSVPFTMGTFKPVVLFPLGMINQLNPQEVEAILAHELAHIKYNDYLINLLFSFIEALFYFHPVVWWLSYEMNASREESCDELAIKIVGNRIQYARTLMNVQERSGYHFSPGMSMAGKKGLLHQRIFKILQQPYPIQAARNKQMGFIALGVLVSFFIIGSLHAHQQDSSKTKVVETYTPDENQNAVFVQFDDEISEKEILVNVSNNESINPQKKKTIIAVARIPKIALDTVPDKRRKDKNYTFSYNSTFGKQTKIKMSNGNIDYLKIDGEEIPPSEYDDYAEEIEALRKAAPPAPPAPPVPPRFMHGGIVAPPVPPAPPILSFPNISDFGDIGTLEFPNLDLDSILREFRNFNVDGLVFEENFQHLSADKMEELKEKLEEQRELFEQKAEERQAEIEKKMEEHHSQMEEFHLKMEEQRAQMEEQMEVRLEEMEVKREFYEDQLEDYQEQRDQEVQIQLEKMKAKKKEKERKTKTKNKRK